MKQPTIYIILTFMKSYMHDFKIIFSNISRGIKKFMLPYKDIVQYLAEIMYKGYSKYYLE